MHRKIQASRLLLDELKLLLSPMMQDQVLS